MRSVRATLSYDILPARPVTLLWVAASASLNDTGAPSSSPRESCRSANVNTAESASMTAVSTSMRTLPVRRNSPASSNSKPVASASSATIVRSPCVIRGALRAHHVRLAVEHRRTADANCSSSSSSFLRAGREGDGQRERAEAQDAKGARVPCTWDSSSRVSPFKSMRKPDGVELPVADADLHGLSATRRSRCRARNAGHRCGSSKARSRRVGALRTSTLPTRSSCEPSFAELARGRGDRPGQCRPPGGTRP